MILRLLILVTLGCLSSAGPIAWDDSKCAQKCNDGSKYQYSEDTTYKYSYESSNELEADKASGLSMHLKATVSLTVLSKCEMVLEVSDVQVQHGSSPQASNIIAQLQRHPLPFSWDDGRIEHVCPNPEDSDEVTNIKKAILSNFQNTMKTFEFDSFNTDTSILGTCDAEYKSKEKGIDQYEITKTINIPTCSDHLKGQTLLLASFYPSSAHRQHLPFLSDEKAACKQIINNGIVEEVTCDEAAYFKPLSDYGYVVKATGNSKIKKLSTSTASRILYTAPKQESLSFKYQAHSHKNENAESEARSILQHICENSEDLITKRAASYVHRLVYTIRQMDNTAVENVYTSLKNGEMCGRGKKAQSIYLDSLRMASSGSSISLLSKLATNGEMSFVDALLWTTMMPFTSYVDEESIAATIPLLEKTVANRQSLLGTTALAYKYCSTHRNCESTQAIREMSLKLKELLGDKCHTGSKEEETEILTVLKAFGNLGYVGESGLDILECANKHDNKIEIRIAAIEAFRRSPCTELITSKILDIYSTKSENDELRVAALMSLSRCPSKGVVQNVVETFNAETSRQVQVFTWSYIENLRSTADPMKAKLKTYLRGVELTEPNSTDITKFSRYFESSFFSELLNLGHVLEADVRHSADSFLPRSGNLGLKLDLFGNQLEALTVGARVEDLEHILEGILGPAGLFSDFNLDDVMSYLPENLKRNKRSADSYQAKIDSLSERLSYKRDKVPHGTAFVRIMGHELGLIRLNEESLRRAAGIKVNDMLKTLASMKDIDTSKNLLFVDLSVLFPSITGRSYKLSSNASLTLGFKAEGKMDLRQSSFPIPRADIDGKFHPSILGEVTAAFTIHSEDFEPGVKVETTFNAGESLKAKVEIKDRLLHIKLKREKKKSEILSLKRTLYYMNDRGEIEMPKPKSHELNYCTKYLDRVLGAQYCASLTLPHVYEDGKYKIPFVRAMEASLTAEETDPSMEGYELFLEIPDLKNEQERRFQLLIDTPNSSEDRKLSLDVQLKQPTDTSCSLTAHFYSRLYSLDVDADMVNRDDHLQMSVEVTGDKRRKYSLNVVSPKVIKGARLVEYQPQITLSMPSKRPLEFSGTVVFSKGRKEQVSVNLESNSFGSPFTIRGNFGKEGEAIDLSSNWKFTYELNASAFSQIHRVHGAMGYVPDKGLLLDLGHHYEPDGRSYESVTFNAKVDNIKIFDRLGFSVDSKILFAEHQDLNTMLQWDFSFKPLDHLNSDFIFRYGENFEDDTHLVRMTIASALKGDFNHFQKMNIENKIALTISCLHIYKSASAIAIWDFIDQPKLQVEVGLKTEKDKEMKFEFDYKHLEAKPLKLATEMTITYNTYKFKYRDEAIEIGPREYQWKSVIVPTQGKEITTDFIYRIKSSGNFHHEIDGHIKFPGLAQPVHQKGLLKFTSTQLDFRDETDFGKGAVYVLDGQLKREGKSEVKLTTPFIDGNIVVDMSSSSQNVRADFKTRDNRRLLVSGSLIPGDKTTLELEINWDADRDSGKKLNIKITLDKETEDGIEKHVITSSVNYIDTVNIEISGKISTDLIRGPHYFKAGFSGKMDPMAIEIDHQIKDGHMNSVTRYLRSGVEKIRLDMKGKLLHSGYSHFEVEFGTFLSSPYKTFDGKLVFFRLLADSKDDTRMFVSEYRIKFAPSIGYEGKIDYQRKRGWPGQIASNLIVAMHNRPLYEGKATVDYGNGKYSIKTSFTPISSKKTHFVASFEHAARFAAFHHSVATNLNYIQTVEINAVADLRSLEDARVQSNMGVNSHQLYDVNTTMKMRSAFDFDSEMTIFSKITPSLRVFSKSQTSGQVTKFDMNLDIDSNTIMTGSGELKKRKRGFAGDIIFKYKEKEILTLTLHQDGKGKTERNNLIKLKFPSRLYTANIKVIKAEKGIFTYETKFCRNEELCFEVDATHKEYDNGNEWQITYRRDDIEFSIERIRESSNDHERFHTVIYNGNHRYGYDVQVGVAENSGRFLSLGIILPSREIVTKGTVEFSVLKPRLKLEFSADGKNHPERKLTTDFRFENHLRDNNPSKLDISIAHPIFEKPIEIELSGDYEPSLSKYLTAEVSVDYSSNPDDKLIGHISLERFQDGMGALLINLYHKDVEHLDFVIKANRTSNKDELSSSIVYNWKGDNNVDREAHVIASYPRQEKRFFFEYKRPRITYRLDGKIVSPDSLLNDTCVIDLESTYNGETTKAKLVADYETGCQKMTILDDEGEVSRVVELCTNLRSRKLVSLTTESFDDEGHWTLDYLFQIVQKNVNTIGIRTQANPEFIGKHLFLLTSLADELDERGVGTLPFYDSPRFKNIRLSFFSKVLKPAKEFFIPEAQKFFKDVQSDMLHLREVAINYYKKLPSFDVVKEKVEVLGSYARSVARHVFSYYQDYIRKYHQYVDELLRTVQEECRKSDECRSLVAAFQNEGWRGILRELRSQMMALPGKVQKFLENPSVEVDKYFKGIVNVLKYLLQPFTKYRCGELVVKAVQLSYERLYPRVQALLNRMPNYYKLIKERLSSDEYLKHSYLLIKEGYLKVREAVMRIDYEKLLGLAQHHLEEYLSTLSPPTLGRFVIVNALNGEKGIVDVNIHVNVLNKIHNRLQSALVAFTKKSIRIGHYNWNTFLINFKRGLDLNFIPPYETQAMIVGHQHFITYDKLFYDFAGECTYLLTRDFEDANFTVALKPGDGNEAASILVLKDPTSVELNSGRSTVKIGDSSIDHLPYISKDLLVTREGSTVIVDTKNGFQVKCNTVHEICTFTISGWYFGKTAGLLGTYNYEQNDEFKRPKGQIANSVTVFAKSWELKRGCKTNNLVADVQINKNSDYYKRCKSLFEESTSPLAACFPHVPPNDYLSLCLRLSAKESNSKTAFCNAATVYVMECEKNYVELNLPAKCLTCDAPDGSKLEHGDRKKFEKITERSADVVFLVEDHDCNKILLSDLGHLARSIEKELQSEGEYRDIMFGLVGFGGDVNDPKIFTFKDKILFGSRDINSVAERFKLETKKLKTSRALESMKYAVTHLFRSHTSKSIVLLSCSPCKYDHTSLQYPVVQQILLERGISLHVIRTEEIQIRKGSKEKNVIGVDPDTVFHAKDITQRDLVGEPELRSQVVVPKDLCVALSQDVRGSFFSTHSISSGASSNEVKNWRNVFARKFLKSTQLPQCQWCDCTATRDHVPHTVCQPCEIKRPRLPFSVGSSNVYTRKVESFLSYILHAI